MNDRNLYLRLCQRNAVYPKSVVAEYNGVKYYPTSLNISFDKDGKTMNSAVMESVIGNSQIQCNLSDVVYLDKTE
jgi:hypothetical protein